MSLTARLYVLTAHLEAGWTFPQTNVTAQHMPTIKVCPVFIIALNGVLVPTNTSKDTAMTGDKDMVTIAKYVLHNRHAGDSKWVLTGEEIQRYILKRYEVRLSIMYILDLLD